MRLACFLLLALTACTGKGGTDTSGPPHGTDTSTDSGTDSATDSGVDTGDPWAGLDRTMCDDVTGKENVPGAATWWIGRYTRSGDSWSGTEYWVWFANDDCASHGGSDCVIAWSVTGTTTTPTCPGCDIGIEVTATIDASNTTCNQGLYSGEETWTATYGLDVQGETLTWYLDSSGTEFGTGTTNGTSYDYQDSGSCRWTCP